MGSLWIAFASAGALTGVALLGYFMGEKLVREAEDHDHPLIEDEEAVTQALERTLAFHLPPYVYLDLNRPYHKAAA